MTRIRATLVALTIGAAAAGTAQAHLERPSYWPDPAPDTSVTPPAGGKVPKAKSLASAVGKRVPTSGDGEVRVVCQDNSLKLAIRSIKAARNSRAVRDLGKAEEIKTSLERTPVDVKVRAGEGGRLFGAVTVNDIASAINTAVGSGSDVVDKRRILVGNPIKSLGAHQVTVKVHDELEATVQLNVIPA